MPSSPLQPFAPPAGLPAHLAISLGSMLGWAFLLVFLLWVLYTAVAGYHWVKYSHAATVAFPAIIVHLAVSVVLMLYILSGVLLP